MVSSLGQAVGILEQNKVWEEAKGEKQRFVLWTLVGGESLLVVGKGDHALVRKVLNVFAWISDRIPALGWLVSRNQTKADNLVALSRERITAANAEKDSTHSKMEAVISHAFSRFGIAWMHDGRSAEEWKDTFNEAYLAREMKREVREPVSPKPRLEEPKERLWEIDPRGLADFKLQFQSPISQDIPRSEVPEALRDRMEKHDAALSGVRATRSKSLPTRPQDLWDPTVVEAQR